MVGVKGLEPPTSCSQSRRATSCATPRLLLNCDCCCGQLCGQRLFLTVFSGKLKVPKARYNARFGDFKNLSEPKAVHAPKYPLSVRLCRKTTRLS